MKQKCRNILISMPHDLDVFLDSIAISVFVVTLVDSETSRLVYVFWLGRLCIMRAFFSRLGGKERHTLTKIEHGVYRNLVRALSKYRNRPKWDAMDTSTMVIIFK